MSVLDDLQAGTGTEEPTGPASPPEPAPPTSTALSAAPGKPLAPDGDVAEVRAQIQQLEDAIVTLAHAVGRQRQQLTADVDDIVAHQGIAIRRQLDEVLDRLTRPEPPPPAAPASRREKRRAHRKARAAAKASKQASKGHGRRPNRPRGQLFVPSLFLVAGLAGGMAVGLSPYDAEAERCQGPFVGVIDSLSGTASVSVAPDACVRAASDRMLLATVPALGGVMAAVAVVVMADGSRSVRAAQPTSRTT